MQELLLCDVLITDYSSSIWDFSFLNKPCFIFCPDYKDYFNDLKDRGIFNYCKYIALDEPSWLYE